MNIGTAVEQYSPELPDHIIHRVQSLLNPKKAAQTTLLSKSWLAAWPTRPTVDLDETYFRKRKRSSSYPKINKFAKFANTTLRRYEESNTSIETFKLRLKSYDVYACSGVATEWTLKALKLGATDFTFKINHPNMAILLDAISGRKNVASLCLQNSEIDRLKVLDIPGLKSLTLRKLNIPWLSFCNLLSCCPLIENLSLYDIDQPYDSSSDDDDGDSSSDESSSEDESSLDDDDDDGKKHVQGVVSFPQKVLLHKLRSLVLCRISSKIYIKSLFLDDLSSKFPNLKDLTLKLSSSCFRKQGEMLILYSLSLEVLNFSVGDDKNDIEKKEMPRFVFDVPSLKEFTLDCTSYMPDLCFTSSPMESRVSLTQHDRLSAAWFLELSMLLTGMRGSKIHLCLHLDNKDSLHYYQPGEINCLNVCGLENLTINAGSFPFLSFIALLDGLFRISRPKMITQHISPPPGNEGDDDDDEEEEESDEEDAMSVDDAENTVNKNDAVLCRGLIQGMKARSLLIPSQLMYDLRDVEELNVQKLLDGVWRPQPLDTILEDSSYKQSKFRFQLKWKP